MLHIKSRSKSQYVELGITTAFSFLHGASQPDEIALHARELGYDAVGIADLNSLAGVVRLHRAAKLVNLRPVIGARLQLVSGHQFLTYPVDRQSYARLSVLISKGRRHDLSGAWQSKGACDLSLDDLAAHAEGLQLIWLPPLNPEPSDLITLASHLPSLRHIAVQRLMQPGEVERINLIDALARAHGLTIMATNDVHYHVPERRPLQDVMTCIRLGTTVDEAGAALNPNAERHLKSPAEMQRLFAPWPHAIVATREVADACRFSLDELRYDYPHETAPPGVAPQDHLRALVAEGAAARYPNGVPAKVSATIETELTLIGRKQLAPYFLTIHQIVTFARSRHILCQGRGSAANSAVCFVLGITPVDPEHHDLLFERFISEDRDEPPDIDVDFEHERREEVIQHIYDTFGRTRAGLCGTVIHYRPRSAIREVGRAMGLSDDVTGALARTVWGHGGDHLDHATEAGLDLSDPRLARTMKIAEQMIGMPRHLSQHVGGFILTEGRLDHTVPIGNGAMPERSFIEWDKDDIDALGILKVDILALGMLSCVRRAFDLMEAHHAQKMTLADVPANDPAVYDMLCRGDSLGVFQVESRAQMNMLPRLRPQTFYDLVIEVAIVRPGPIQGDMVHPYLRRRMGQEPEEYPSPAPPHDPDELRKILKRTLGVPIFQEQAMKIAMVAARFNSAEANELRKAMATFRSRGTIEALQDKMVGRMIERGYDPVFSKRCFNQIKGFGEYGFPESHAAAFAQLVYVSAYIKCHRPAAFACALLNSQPMGFYAPAQIVGDAQQHGVEIRAVDVNFSDWDCTLEPIRRGLFALRLGMRMIDGLAHKAGARIVAARDTPYTGVEDLARRTGVDAGNLRRLAEADAFGSAGLNRRAALWQARGWRDAPALPLFQGQPGEEDEAPVILPAMPRSEEVVADYHSLRLSLRAHPMCFLRRSLAAQHYLSAEQVNTRRGGAARMAGLVLIRQKPGSAKGVCFITIEDETGVVNLVIWPKLVERFRREVMTARLLDARGHIQRDQHSGTVHLVVSELRDRSDVLARLADRGAGGEDTPAKSGSSAGHPRNARILPPSRDFH